MSSAYIILFLCVNAVFLGKAWCGGIKPVERVERGYVLHYYTDPSTTTTTTTTPAPTTTTLIVTTEIPHPPHAVLELKEHKPEIGILPLAVHKEKPEPPLLNLVLGMGNGVHTTEAPTTHQHTTLSSTMSIESTSHLTTHSASHTTLSPAVHDTTVTWVPTHLDASLKDKLMNNSVCKQSGIVEYMDSLDRQRLKDLQEVLNTPPRANDVDECRNLLAMILAKDVPRLFDQPNRKFPPKNVALLMCIYSFTSFRVHDKDDETLKKINFVTQLSGEKLKQQRGLIAVKRIIPRLHSKSAEKLFRRYLNNNHHFSPTNDNIDGESPSAICGKELKYWTNTE